VNNRRREPAGKIKTMKVRSFLPSFGGVGGGSGTKTKNKKLNFDKKENTQNTKN
jgi:hypothetical protein